MAKFIITGGKKLSGEVTVNSAKNSAVALIIASLINRGITRLKNVPAIEEVNRLVEVLVSLGVPIKKENNDLVIGPVAKIDLKNINIVAAQKTRSIIMMLGALSSRLKEYAVPQAGGCLRGNRHKKWKIILVNTGER